MKNVLFIANTEGHLLTISSLIFERFNAAAGYQPYILQVGKTGTARFKNETDKALLSDKYFEIDPAGMTIKEEIKEILDTTFVNVFIFLEQLSLNVYLADYFKKRGSTICLAPDGNKPYFTVDRMALRSRVMQTMATYKYLFARGLSYFRPYFLSWNYARLNPVDEVWVTYPGKFNNVRKKKVVGFQLLPNVEVTKKVIAFFKLNISDALKETGNIIFYANNVLYRKEVYEVEIEAICTIQKKFPGTPFYLKYHPSTPAYQVQKFKDAGLICFCNSRPAELYIASLNNSIVLGCWSAALMVNNPACKFYWLHNYLVKEGKMILDLVNLVNPTRHIIDVENLDDIIF
jgi:hypothetical protein